VQEKERSPPTSGPRTVAERRQKAVPPLVMSPPEAVTPTGGASGSVSAPAATAPALADLWSPDSVVEPLHGTDALHTPPSRRPPVAGAAMVPAAQVARQALPLPRTLQRTIATSTRSGGVPSPRTSNVFAAEIAAGRSPSLERARHASAHSSPATPAAGDSPLSTQSPALISPRLPGAPLLFLY
jgi:hypothetical protein